MNFFHRLACFSALLLAAFQLGAGAGPASDTALTSVTYASGFPLKKDMVWAVHITAPFAMHDPTKTGRDQFTGFVPEMALLLEQVLNVNFTMKLGVPVDPYNEEKILDLLKMDADGTDADLAGGAIHVSANRSLTVRFSTPYFQSGFRLVVQLPLPVHDPMSFGSPFDHMLWLCVGFEILIVAIAIYAMEAPAMSFSEVESDLHEGRIEGFMDCIYMSCTFMLGTADKAPKTWGGKLTLLAHGWFMLIIVASYTANLASFLVAAAIQPTVTGWADITGSAGKLSIAVPRNSAQQDFLTYETKHYSHKFNVTWTNNMVEAYDLVASGQVDATFEDEAIVQYYLLNTRANPCELMTVGRTFHDVAYGLAFDLSNLDFIPFSEAIVFLRETGEIGRLASKYQVGAGGMAAEDAQVGTCVQGAGNGVLIVDDMVGLLGLVAGILGLAVFVHGGERHKASMDKKKVTPEEEGKGGAGGEGGGGAGDAEIPVQGVGRDQAAMDAAIRAGVQVGLKAAMEKMEESQREMFAAPATEQPGPKKEGGMS